MQKPCFISKRLSVSTIEKHIKKLWFSDIHFPVWFLRNCTFTWYKETHGGRGHDIYGMALWWVSPSCFMSRSGLALSLTGVHNYCSDVVTTKQAHLQHW